MKNNRYCRSDRQIPCFLGGKKKNKTEFTGAAQCDFQVIKL